MQQDGSIISKAAPNGLKTYPTKVLLIDDQPIIAEAIRQMLADDKNLIFYYCEDPEKALQKALEIHPTIILQDLVMPNLNGFELLESLKADPILRDVPIIVLSTKEDPLIKAEAFAKGAVDYIVKVPDKIELLARVKHHSEAYTRLLERNETYTKLVESQAILKADLMNAAMYVTSLLPLPLLGDIEANWRFIPSAQLGGDAFGYYWLDADHFIFYLLDVCGHGVGAALLSITIANVIRSQALIKTDFSDPAHVLSSLNDMFPMERHNDMYFTMWYGIYNKKTRLLKYSSGGHPPALLYDPSAGEKPIRLDTKGLAIGALPHVTYTNNYYQIPFKNRLFLLSDGVYELENSKNEILTLDDFIVTLNQYVRSFHNDLDKIVKMAQQAQGKTVFPDDFSIIEFTFN